ncbi:MAG TPA: hypothetical protein VGF24_12350 [Vicinamibacterales bacterium]
MMIRSVPAREWRSFFERFSREHRAWRATIHGIERRAPVTCVPSEALESVTLDTRGSDHVVRLTFANGLSLCAPQPRDVRVQSTDEGVPCALEVETADEAFVRLAFRATAVPAQLDGIGPGEA